MLASMSEIDPRADAPLVDWSELGVSGLLPTGTVTLLLADVEGSTRLWETQPEEMTAAFARLDHALCDLVAAHGGVRPVEQGEGDSFVAAFARASDAVACALELQRAPLAPIRLRIGVHTGEVQLRDEGNYIGPTINRTARLRDLAHGGQTVLSGTTEDLVADRLPADAWLTDLGTSPAARSAPSRAGGAAVPSRPSSTSSRRCAHPEPLSAHNLPVQLTSFVGRGAQMTEVREAAGRQPAGDLDRRRRGGQDPSGGPGRGPASPASSVTGCGMWIWRRSPIPSVVPVDGGARAGPARPTRPLHDGHAAAVRSRPPDAGGAGQLRTPARRERRAGRRSPGCRAGADRCWPPVVSRSGWPVR